MFHSLVDFNISYDLGDSCISVFLALYNLLSFRVMHILLQHRRVPDNMLLIWA